MLQRFIRDKNNHKTLGKSIDLQEPINLVKHRAFLKLPFEEDHMKQDAIAVNLQRAAEQVLDLANHVIKQKKLGLPKESKESFDILFRAGVIPGELAEKLKGMVGFRNVLVHQYEDLDLKIMVDVIEHRLGDLVDFTDYVLKYMHGAP